MIKPKGQATCETTKQLTKIQNAKLHTLHICKTTKTQKYNIAKCKITKNTTYVKMQN